MASETPSSQVMSDVPIDDTVEKEWKLDDEYSLAVLKTKVTDLKKQLKLYSEIARLLHEDDWKYPKVQDLLKF